MKPKSKLMTDQEFRKEFVVTADGSPTFRIPGLNETYHSVHGARTESEHVFIRNGLEHYFLLHRPSSLTVGEAGFGTGLNALLTGLWAAHRQIPVLYDTYEKYPLSPKLIEIYGRALEPEEQDLFARLHAAPWEKPIKISPYFHIIKRQRDFREIDRKNFWHVFYHDAFSPRVQPHLWETSLFRLIRRGMIKDGVWVTYSAKGSVRRNLIEAGFKVEKLPGPPGKREMLRAINVI